MQRTRRYRLLTAILLVLAASAAAAPQGEYYGSGYTIISQEHGNDDLQATVYRQLTPGTVGQALPQLLDGTGWRLADSHAADDRIYRLYNQPLPEHKLRIGPMPLDQALTWIAGDGWALVVDPVNRLVSFEVEARYDSRPPVGIHSRPAATSHVPDVAPAATPVYADLPPQGSFPAVQTAPDYSVTTYRTPAAAYPAPPREDWQNALPQRLSPLLCRTAGFLWLLGLLAFCGSLYAMAFMPTLNVRMLVPVGGIAFLLGWTMLLSAACLGDRYAR